MADLHIIMIILITSGFCILFYSALLVWTLIDFKRFVIDQKRYRTFAVWIFYVCAIIIELLRCLMFANNFTVYASPDIGGILCQLYVYNFCYTISLFVIVILGFYQV